MNFVFWLLVIFAAVFLWFCLAFSYKRFGGFWKKLYDDAVEEMKDEEKEKEGSNE